MSIDREKELEIVNEAYKNKIEELESVISGLEFDLDSIKCKLNAVTDAELLDRISLIEHIQLLEYQYSLLMDRNKALLDDIELLRQRLETTDFSMSDNIAFLLTIRNKNEKLSNLVGMQRVEIARLTNENKMLKAENDKLLKIIDTH